MLCLEKNNVKMIRLIIIGLVIAVEGYTEVKQVVVKSTKLVTSEGQKLSNRPVYIDPPVISSTAVSLNRQGKIEQHCQVQPNPYVLGQIKTGEAVK